MIKRISILTLFPESINSFINSSIIKKAIDNNKVVIELINFRNYSNNKHQKVDDYQYGGGPGMVLALQPIIDCLKTIKTKKSYTILTSASGCLYSQAEATRITNNYEHLIIICGHYEGVDERINEYIDSSICIGDYILTGGESASIVIIDSIVRLIDGVINKESLTTESFNENLLDYPVYTKPINYENHLVPEILLSGNHKKILEYRNKQRILKTKKNRPDLYNKFLKENKNNGNL